MVQGIERRRNNPRKKLIKKKIKVNALESNVQTILPETSDQDQVEANSLNTESQNNKSESSFPKSQDTVILLNRLPHGFLEPQLKTFFSQFGDIKRMRLIRSKKVKSVLVCFLKRDLIAFDDVFL
jgi:RNA recognition motif-containing protein